MRNKDKYIKNKSSCFTSLWTDADGGRCEERHTVYSLLEGMGLLYWLLILAGAH